MNERKVNKVALEKINTGSLHLFKYWGKIKAKDTVRDDKYTVEGIDSGPGTFNVEGKSLIENSYSADQFSEEIKASRTEVAEVLVSSYDRPLTVNFDTKDGSNRTLRGRLSSPEPLLGRSYVEDLDEATDNKLRLVDHRTLHWLIVNGMKYVVK